MLSKQTKFSPDVLASLDATLPPHREALPRQPCSVGVVRVRVLVHGNPLS